MKNFFQKKSVVISLVILVILVIGFILFKNQSAAPVAQATVAEPEIASQVDVTDSGNLQDALNEAQVESVRNCFPEYTTSFDEPFTAKDFVDVVLTDYKVDTTGSIQNEQDATDKKEFTFELAKNGTKEGQVNYFAKGGQILEFTLQLSGKYLGCNETSCHCEN